MIVQLLLVFARFTVALSFLIFSTALHAQPSLFICEKWQNVGTHSKNRSFIAKQINDTFTIKNQWGTDLTISFIGKHNEIANFYAGRHPKYNNAEICAVVFVPTTVWVEWDLEIIQFNLFRNGTDEVKSHCFRE